MRDPLLPLMCEPARADGKLHEDIAPFGVVQIGCEDIGGALGVCEWLKFCEAMIELSAARCERHIERCERRNARNRAYNAHNFPNVLEGP